MPLQDAYLEKVWDDLLSRDTQKVRSRFFSLDDVSRKNVLEHLRKMASEDGWHPEQVKSVRIALEVLSDAGK